MSAAPEYFEVVAELAAANTRTAQLVEDVAALRETVQVEQAKRSELAAQLAGLRNRADRAEQQLADALAATGPQWAVCRIAPPDEAASTAVVSWPIAASAGVTWHQLERGPFTSEFEACVQLLLAVGAYPDTPEGYGDAAAFMLRRPRTMAAQANEVVKHPAVGRYVPPSFDVMAEVEPVAPEAWDEVLRRWS